MIEFLRMIFVLKKKIKLFIQHSFNISVNDLINAHFLINAPSTLLKL